MLVVAVVLYATPGVADEKMSRACRGRIAKELVKLVQSGFRQVDKCRKTQVKQPGDGGVCNVIDSPDFDPTQRYRAARDKARGKIAGKCPAGDPVLANYPAGDVAAVLLAIDDSVAGNSVLIQGNANLEGDGARTRCIRAIGKARAKVFSDILRTSTKCQGRRDKRASSFGAIADDCIGTGARAASRAGSAIGKACGNLSGLGTCTPLPQCAVDAARRNAQSLARAVYFLRDAPTCGDGATDFPEQCDDGNTAAGDGCSAVCELEGHSCGTPLGPRMAQVSLTTPQPLAGVRIDFEYPQFQSGIPGTLQASIVRSHVTVVQGTAGEYVALANDNDSNMTVVVSGAAAFIASGPLLDVSLDACIALAENICNRNTNVYGCCPSGDIANCFAAPPACTTFDTQTLNRGVPAGCCPTDNACITQAVATACSVTDPVDASGHPVDGVTCSVATSGT